VTDKGEREFHSKEGPLLSKEDALRVFSYRPELVEAAGAHFDRVVAQILEKDFTIKRAPNVVGAARKSDPGGGDGGRTTRKRSLERPAEAIDLCVSKM